MLRHAGVSQTSGRLTNSIIEPRSGFTVLPPILPVVVAIVAITFRLDSVADNCKKITPLLRFFKRHRSKVYDIPIEALSNTGVHLLSANIWAYSIHILRVAS